MNKFSAFKQLTTKRQKNNQTTAANTRLCALAAEVHLAGFCSRIHFVVPRQRMLPQTAKCP